MGSDTAKASRRIPFMAMTSISAATRKMQSLGLGIVVLPLFFLLVMILGFPTSRGEFMMNTATAGSNSGPEVKQAIDLVIFAATMYPNISTPRFKESIASIKNARDAGFNVAVCDNSPSEEVRQIMRKAGAVVRKQSKKGKKGVGLREALELAARMVKGKNNHAILAFQELEKGDMPLHWDFIRKRMEYLRADIAVPKRDDSYFGKTYPIGQYHSESFGAAYLNAMAREKLRMVGISGSSNDGLDSDQNYRFPNAAAHKSKSGSSGGRNRTANKYYSSSKWQDIDWLFGPFAFRKEWADFWLRYDGSLWDAQILPMVYAIRSGAKIISVEVLLRRIRELVSNRVSWFKLLFFPGGV